MGEARALVQPRSPQSLHSPYQCEERLARYSAWQVNLCPLSTLRTMVARSHLLWFSYF